MANIIVRNYKLTTAYGAELGTFVNLDELANAIVEHFGRGYIGLAKVLVTAISEGRNTSRIELVLGVHVETYFDALAA